MNGSDSAYDDEGRIMDTLFERPGRKLPANKDGGKE
jgi:hypothetical protein